MSTCYLKLQHTQTFKKGVASLRQTKPSYVPIDFFYDDGSVSVNGECWEVKPTSDKSATFETTGA